MLVPLNLQRLSSEELIELVTMHLNCVEDAKIQINDPIVERYFQKLSKGSQELSIAINEYHTHTNDTSVSEADRVRDRALSVFRRLMQVFELSDDDTPEAHAYEALDEMWKKYEAIQYMSLSVETEGIDNLLFDLGTSRYAPHVATLQLESAVDKIRHTNESFKTIYEQSSNDVADTAKSYYDARRLRNELMKNLGFYTDYVHAMAKSAEDKNVQVLFELLNKTRSHFVHRLTTRHAGKSTSC